MQDENLQNVSNEEVEKDSNYYIETISEMKKNSVPREDYEKLKAENQAMLKAFAIGEEIDVGEHEEPVDLDALRQKLFNEDSDMSNLDYVKNALKLRRELIKRGEADPFVPHGEKILPTNDDYEAADRVAKVFEECIEYADGDNEIFTNELMRRTTDAFPMGSNNFRRK